MYDLQSTALTRYAKQNGVRFDVKSREKIILIRVPAIPANKQIKIFFPYDSVLNSSIITGMRSAGTDPGVFPANWSDGVAMAANARFKDFVMWIKNKNKEWVFQDFPLFQLLQDAVTNSEKQVRCCFMMDFEKSFIMYYDLTARSNVYYFPIIFTYHPLLSD